MTTDTEFFTALRAKATTASKAATPQLPTEDIGGGYVDSWHTGLEPNSVDLIENYRNLIYSCANLNAGAVAQTPLRLYVTTKEGERAPRVKTVGVSDSRTAYLKKVSPALGHKAIREVVSHPLLSLLESVSSVLDGFELIELTLLYQEIVGDAYWYLPRAKGGLTRGLPEAIWILPAHLVTINRNNSKEISSYTYKPGANVEITFKKEEILHFRYPSLLNPYGAGISPARASYTGTRLMDETRAYQYTLLANKAAPGTIVSPKESLGADESDRLEARLRRKLRRGGNGGLLVADHAVDIVPFAIPPRDMEMLAIHGMGRVDVANAFGIPMSLLDTKDVNRSNAEAGHYQHAKMAVAPRCIRTAQKLNQGFVQLYDPRLFLAFDNPVPSDVSLESQVRERNLRIGTTTRNEERAAMGFKPIDGGDVLLVPMGFTPLEQVLKEPDPTPEPEPVAVPEEDSPGEDNEDG